jgi:hypothetical protein
MYPSTYTGASFEQHALFFQQQSLCGGESCKTSSNNYDICGVIHEKRVFITIEMIYETTCYEIYSLLSYSLLVDDR